MGRLISQLYLAAMGAMGINPGRAIQAAIDSDDTQHAAAVIIQEPKLANTMIHWRDPRQASRQHWGLPTTYAVAASASADMVDTLLNLGADMDPDTLRAAYDRLVTKSENNIRGLLLRSGPGEDGAPDMRAFYNHDETREERKIIAILTRHGARWDLVDGDLSSTLLGDIGAMIGAEQMKEIELGEVALSTDAATAVLHRLAAAGIT